MIFPGGTINKDIIKEHNHTLAEERLLRVEFMAPWNVLGAPVRPKAITVNSKWPQWV